MRMMKLRLLTMGVIICTVGSILGISRGFSLAILGLIGAGAVLLVVGVIMK